MKCIFYETAQNTAFLNHARLSQPFSDDVQPRAVGAARSGSALHHPVHLQPSAGTSRASAAAAVLQPDRCERKVLPAVTSLTRPSWNETLITMDYFYFFKTFKQLMPADDALLFNLSEPLDYLTGRKRFLNSQTNRTSFGNRNAL